MLLNRAPKKLKLVLKLNEVLISPVSVVQIKCGHTQSAGLVLLCSVPLII